MVKRFVPVRDANQRALELYFMLREIEQMPLIGLEVDQQSKKPIVLRDKSDPKKFWTYTVDQVLQIEIEQVKAQGSTWFALTTSKKRPPRPRIPQAEVDRAVNKFMLGEDDE